MRCVNCQRSLADNSLAIFLFTLLACRIHSGQHSACWLGKLPSCSDVDSRWPASRILARKNHRVKHLEPLSVFLQTTGQSSTCCFQIKPWRGTYIRGPETLLICSTSNALASATSPPSWPIDPIEGRGILFRQPEPTCLASVRSAVDN